MKDVNCRRCRHYYVTWDAQRPHGCRKMGFKSRQMPSVVVQKTTSGMGCLLFQPKTVKSS